MDLLEKSVEKWKALYLFGEQMKVNRGMAFGRMMADGLENNDATGDIMLDLVISKIPKFEVMDKIVMAELKNGKKTIQILAKPDTMKADMTAFKEYKTGQEPWTQKRFNELGQIIFYATALYLKTGSIPQDIEGVWAQTKKEDNGPLDAKIRATGEIRRFKVVVTMADVLKMMIRMKKAWALIEKVCEEELL